MTFEPRVCLVPLDRSLGLGPLETKDQGYHVLCDTGTEDLINTNTEDCCGERRWWQTAAGVLSSK